LALGDENVSWLSGDDGDGAGEGEDSEHDGGGREKGLAAAGLPPEEPGANRDHDKDEDELAEGHAEIIDD